MATTDAHLTGAPTTLNEQLFDRALRHKVHLQGYANGLARRMYGVLRRSQRDIERQLSQRLADIDARGGLDRGPWTTRRMREMLVGLRGMINDRYDAWAVANETHLSALGQAEGKFAAGMIQATLPVHIEMTLPNPVMLAAIAHSRPFEGRVLSGWARTMAQRELAAIARELQQGLTLGETVSQLMRRVGGVSGALSGNKHHAAAVTRTYVNHVSTQAHNMTYAANDDIIRGVQMVATLDSRTTAICRYQDGRVYPVDSGPRPPFHFNCRTVAAPVLKSWKEMGINLKAVPGGTRAAAGTKIGQVPAKTTYATWFKRQGAGFQRQVLGPKRYELFRRGVHDVREFATPEGRMYTLKDLYRMFPEEAKAAGLIK